MPSLPALPSDRGHDHAPSADLPVEDARAEAPRAGAVSISAAELHSRLVTSFRIGNRARREFVELLLAIEEGRLHLKLGAPSITAYAARHFGHQRSETFEALRVARALRSLPRLVEAFDHGEVSWSLLKELTKVATPETEATWLEFASSRSVRKVRAEVRDALRHSRKEPRKGSRGLPDLEVVVRFELRLAEHDLLEKAIGKVMREMRERLGPSESETDGAANADRPRLPSVEPKDALLHMARRMLETDLDDPDSGGTPPGRRERETPVDTILYHRCPDCQRAAVITGDGPVEVDGERLDRIEGEAEVVRTPEDLYGEPAVEPAVEPAPRMAEGAGNAEGSAVEVDRPNRPTLTRRVLLRDARTCANPWCGARLHLHAHHIVFRSVGGRTTLGNECAACATCHALVHEGLLRVEGNPVDGLRWEPAADRLPAGLEADLQRVQRLGLGESGLGRSGLRESGRQDSRGTIPAAGCESCESCENSEGSADPEGSEELIQALARGMRNLGYRLRDALERVRRAHGRIAAELGRQPTESELLRGALGAR